MIEKIAKDSFRFKQFSVSVFPGVFPVSTDSVLLGSWLELNQAKHILDIGTGSGLLALMIAQESVSETVILGVEIDENSVQCAQYNFNQSPWNFKLNVFQSDIQNLKHSICNIKLWQNLDLIISNPPYFINALHSPSVDKNRTRHQNQLTYSELAEFASNYLNDEGKICLVVPSNDEVKLKTLMGDKNLSITRLLRIKNKLNAACKRILIEFSKKASDLEIDEMYLYDENNNRSEAYSQLTRNFYL